MDFIDDLDEIKENIETFDKCLQDPTTQDFAISLVKEGTSFVAVLGETGYSFYPSRYVGYRNNSYETYTKESAEVMKDPSPSISQVLKHNPNPAQDLEMEYTQFCADLGFMAAERDPAGNEHKYWKIAI